MNINIISICFRNPKPHLQRLSFATSAFLENTQAFLQMTMFVHVLSIFVNICKHLSTYCVHFANPVLYLPTYCVGNGMMQMYDV